MPLTVAAWGASTSPTASSTYGPTWLSATLYPASARSTHYTDIRFAGHKGPIRQFLVYIGGDPLTMADGIDEPELLDYHYSPVDMHRINCAGLLVQDNPDALVLAVLCDFGDREPQEVVTYIVRRLKELLGSDEKQFREYMTMLEILSENRDLKTQVVEAERMLTEVDVKRLPSYPKPDRRGNADNDCSSLRVPAKRCDSSVISNATGAS